MFVDRESDCAEFSALPRSRRVLEEKEQQTVGIVYKNAECQSVGTENKRIQTESVADGGAGATLDGAGAARLAKFLLVIEPVMSRQLERNLSSRAFDDYSISADVGGEQLTRLYNLSAQRHLEAKHRLQCTDICWSSTGSVIGVSFGARQHDGWCTHAARVAFWNLNRRGLQPDKPDVEAATSVCVTCLRFHPLKPSLVVGGNYNGEILMWNLGLADDLLVTKTSSDLPGHDEPVTCVRWIPEPGSSGKYSLVSCSLDGRILIWTYNARHSRIQLQKGYVILAQDLPRSMRPANARFNGEVGVISIAVVPESSSLLFVGLEGGGLLHCSLESKTVAKGSWAAHLTLLVPVIVACTPHDGQLTDISCSVHGRHLVATCSSDCELRVYAQSKSRSPLLVVHWPSALTSVDWSPARPAILAAGSASGQLLLHDVTRGDHRGGAMLVQSCAETEGAPSAAVTRVRFNANDLELLAVGDVSGAVHVWRLGDQYGTGADWADQDIQRLDRL